MTLGFEKSHTPQLADLQKGLLFLWMKDGENARSDYPSKKH